MPYSSQGRATFTITYAVAYAVVAVSYIVAPPARVSRPGVVSVARYIDGLGPVWTVGFGLVALALVGTLLLRQGQWIAHSVAAAIVAGYGAASLLSGILSDTFYGSPVAMFCGATTVVHLVLARRYQFISVGGRHEP